MTIRGITDGTRRNRSRQYCGTLHKGRQKTGKGKDTRPGGDLNKQLRYHPFNDSGKCLLNYYKDATQDANKDILLNSLDVYLAYDTIEKTFDTNLKNYGDSGLSIECDGETITGKREEGKDMFDQPRSRMVPCNEPCPLADQPPGSQCPKGCTQEGILTFYIIPVVAGNQYGSQLPCKLTVKGWADITGIQDQLEDQLARIRQFIPEWNSVSLSPFPGESEYGNMIPYIISRVQQPIKRPLVDTSQKIPMGSRGQVAKRTGGKTSGTTWSIEIRPHPYWLEQLQRWEAMKQVKSLGFAPDPKLLEGTRVINVEAHYQRSLPSPTPVSPDVEPLLNQEQYMEAQAVLKANWATVWGGNAEKFKEALSLQFGEVSQGMIPASRFEELKQFFREGPTQK